MADLKTEFTVAFEGEIIPVIVTEVEQEDDSVFYAEIPGHERFEIFLSEEDMWVTNDEVSVDEDLIFLIGDTFESLQP
ncbi:hypothetical protein SAMN06265348_104417 [Pedobacter westerhofensis]|uniref:Uncharacterized protein n=1 Tax=Pedobacter westerhofensis TaxID=425512 RepID=A0A521D2G4_9SPHI|nr:hypothetical protein [Pedobacter westerhofensis]SMO65888.1 hypothetical protein SAMN06265348_104417 [Pedobacter westerhofensis]